MNLRETPMSARRTGKLGLAWSWQVPVLLLAVIAWVVFLLSTRPSAPVGEGSAVDALSSIQKDFDAGHYRDAIKSADRYLQAKGKKEFMAEAHFLRGMSALKLKSAGQVDSAATDLAEALEWGLEGSDARTARKALATIYLQRGDWAEAGPLVESVVADGDSESIAIAKALAEQYLKAGRIEEARSLIEKALTIVTEPQARLELTLVLARGLRESGDAAQAEELLKAASRENVTGVAMKTVQLELGRVLQDERKSAEARRIFLAVTEMRPRSEELERAARFGAAECSLALGGRQLADAEVEFKAIASEYPGTEEGVAAQMRLARIYLGDGARRDEARSQLSRLLAKLGEKGRLVNRYASDSDLRTMWGEVLHNDLQEGAFKEARQLIAEGDKLGQQDVLRYWKGMTYEREADALDAKAKGLAGQGLGEDAKKLTEEARGLRLSAAKLYLEIVNGSESARSPLFGKALWQGATCLYEGGDYAQAAVYYGLYHRQAKNEERAGARLQYGRAMAKLGNHRDAIEKFESVAAEYPGTIEAVKGQLESGLSYLALGDVKGARRAFEGIVKDEKQLTPAAEEWQRALVMLGMVCYAAGDYETAARRLEESLGRGLGNEETRFYLAESLRLRRADTVKAREENLTRAAGLLEHFIVEGAKKVGTGEGVEEMMRNARFERAGCLFELGRYEEGGAGYREYAQLYTGSEEAVTAQFRLATCYERLGLSKEAEETKTAAQWSAGRLKKSGTSKAEPVLARYWRTLESDNVTQVVRSTKEKGEER